MKKIMAFDKNLFRVTTSQGTLCLFSLLFPILFENIMNQLLGTVNTIVLSGYSEDSVAAVGAATGLVTVITIFFSVIATGSTVVVSNFIGAERKKSAGETVFSALLLGVLISLVLSPILYLSGEKLMLTMNLSGKILEEAILYFKIRVLFLIFPCLSSILLATLRCYGYPKYTIIVGLITNLINLLLTVFVIHFPGNTPVTGVAGVASACVISQVVGLLLSAFLLFKTRIPIFPVRKGLFGYISKILGIGIPSGLSSISFTFSQTVTTSFIALIGAYALSAKVYYANILSYVFLFSLSAGNANALLVGRLYGAGKYEHAKQLNAQLVKITVFINFLISLTVILLRKPLLAQFTQNQQIITLALGIFLIDLLVEQARAVSQVYEYALRATGDVLFSLIILICSCWIFSIGLSYFLAIKCNLGLIGCWIGLAVDEWIRAIVTYFRWRSGKWQKERHKGE